MSKEQNQTTANRLRKTLGVGNNNFVLTKQNRQARRELMRFAQDAETLLQSARMIAPLLTRPEVQNNAEVLAAAPAFAAKVKSASDDLLKIHKSIESLDKARDRTEYNIGCLSISQQYIDWNMAYSENALPLAQRITDAVMAAGVEIEGATPDESK